MRIYATATPLRMGSQDGCTYFKGAIDNVYFYNRI
jgi:hypothetical protein